MTHTVQLLQCSDVGASASPRATVAWARQVRDKAHRLGTRIAASLDAYAASLGDAALYQELSKLSDAELHRRGLSRGDLHRSVAGS
jgi:hypothetical protein